MMTSGTISITKYSTTSYERRRKPPIKRPMVQNGFRHEARPPCYLQRGIVPLNMAEEKEKFLKFGSTPEFKLRDAPCQIEQALNAKLGQINFQLFHDAKRILDTVVERFHSLDQYVALTYGPRINNEEATRILKNYLEVHRLEKHIRVIWCEQLAASAQMTWIGPDAKFNKPEARNYTLLIKSTSENNFVRERGIRCLADHEIGTHYIRSVNDGLQPWFSDRKKYDLCASKSYDVIKSEEGLAALHTILHAKYKYLCMPALLYYNACMAEYLSFKQLFYHLEKYVKDPEQRWKHCMRVKRGLKNTESKGGYGKDQRYFEGAVEILRHMDEIDFNILICGRICWDEVPRIRRVCRLSATKIPHFMANMGDYMSCLRQIAEINGVQKLAAGATSNATEAEINRTRAQLIEDLRHYDVVVSHKGLLWGVGSLSAGSGNKKCPIHGLKRGGPKRRVSLRRQKRLPPNKVGSVGDDPEQGEEEAEDGLGRKVNKDMAGWTDSCPDGDTTIYLELETYHPISQK